ncbi:MAG: hypothetical protein IJO79_06245 [Firmicutes bacterium]|nr:hypothetical protein [Bacillota bacterium]
MAKKVDHPVMYAMGKMFLVSIVGLAALTAAVIAVDKVKENGGLQWLDEKEK